MNVKAEIEKLNEVVVLESNDGTLYLLVRNRLFSEGGWMDYRGYSRNLVRSGSTKDGFTIRRVYTAPLDGLNKNLSWNFGSNKSSLVLVMARDGNGKMVRA